MCFFLLFFRKILRPLFRHFWPFTTIIFTFFHDSDFHFDSSNALTCSTWTICNVFLILARWIGRKFRYGKIKESHQSQPKPKGSPKWYPKTKEVCLQANVLEGCWSKGNLYFQMYPHFLHFYGPTSLVFTNTYAWYHLSLSIPLQIDTDLLYSIPIQIITSVCK